MDATISWGVLRIPGVASNGTPWNAEVACVWLHFRVQSESRARPAYGWARRRRDTALAMQVPYANDGAPIASQTLSTAQGGGWIWDIGLPSRRGVGLVYSSAHLSEADAERTLLDHVARTGGPGNLPAPRKLRFNPGHRERFWHRNCAAVGLAAGFIEPLEASALAAPLSA